MWPRRSRTDQVDRPIAIPVISVPSAAELLGVSERRIMFWVMCERLASDADGAGTIWLSETACLREQTRRLSETSTRSALRTALDIVRYMTGYPVVKEPRS